jgi:zinc protease
LVLKDQTATTVTAFAGLEEIGGQFHIRAMVRPGADAAAVEKAMDEEVARFLSEGPSAGELKAVQTRTVAGWVRQVERVGGFGGKSDVLANGQVYAGDPAAYKQTLANYQSATPAAVKDVANRWLSDGVFILRVDPFPRFDVISKTDADRTKVPEPGPMPTAKFPRIERATLSNGLKIALVERHEIPVVQFRLILDAGYAADQNVLPGTASMASGALSEGTKKRTLLQITEESDMLGAIIGANSNVDTTSVSLNALKVNLDASLELFADVALNPSFPESEINRRKRQTLAQIAQEKEQPVSMALRVLPKLMYGPNHAYGNSLTGSGTAESVSKMTRADIEKFHQTWFKPNNGTMVVVGDTTLAEVQPKLETLFGAWKPGEVPRKTLTEVPHKDTSRVYLVDKPGAIQSIIFAGHIAPPRNNPDEVPVEVMNEILGGKFTSRINMNLREDKHWSYGARSIFQSAKGQSPFFVYAPVQTDKTKESLQEVLKELRGIIRDKPVTEEELSVTKDNMTLRLPGQRETMSAITGDVAETITYGLPPDYHDTYAPKVRAVTRQNVATVAEKVLRPDKMIWVVVGDKARIEAGIRELNFGPMEYLDADGNPVRQ